MPGKKQLRQIKLQLDREDSRHYSGLLDRFHVELTAVQFTSTHKISEKPPSEIRVWLEWMDDIDGSK